MSDHRVHGVDRTIRTGADRAAKRPPERRRDDRIDRVLGHRFDDGSSDGGCIELVRIATDERRERGAGTVEIVGFEPRPAHPRPGRAACGRPPRDPPPRSWIPRRCRRLHRGRPRSPSTRVPTAARPGRARLPRSSSHDRRRRPDARAPEAHRGVDRVRAPRPTPSRPRAEPAARAASTADAGGDAARGVDQWRRFTTVLPDEQADRLRDDDRGTQHVAGVATDPPSCERQHTGADDRDREDGHETRRTQHRARRVRLRRGTRARPSASQASRRTPSRSPPRGRTGARQARARSRCATRTRGPRRARCRDRSMRSPRRARRA